MGEAIVASARDAALIAAASHSAGQPHVDHQDMESVIMRAVQQQQLAALAAQRYQALLLQQHQQQVGIQCGGLQQQGPGHGHSHLPHGGGGVSGGGAAGAVNPGGGMEFLAAMANAAGLCTSIPWAFIADGSNFAQPGVGAAAAAAAFVANRKGGEGGGAPPTDGGGESQKNTAETL